MPSCDPWPGQYENPWQYDSTCGHIEVFTARMVGWSCAHWAAVHDLAVQDMMEECPPV